MPRRTTLTLDDDIIDTLRDRARREDRPLKAIVNDALRAGLSADAPPPSRPYRIRARDMGMRPGIDLDDIQGLLETIDGPGRT